MLLTNTIWIRMFLSEINHRVNIDPDEIVGAVNKENINHYTTLLIALPTSRTLIRVLRCRTGGLEHAGIFFGRRKK